MAIIAKYKFNPSLYADYLPTFNAEFTGYTKTDVTNSDGTITRTISHDALKPTIIRFGTTSSGTNREKSLLEVIECDTSQVTNMNRMFQECRNLTSINLSSFNTSKVTDMLGMFVFCSSLTSLDLSSFDTSKVTNMNSMFNSCSKLTSLDLSNFDTSQVTNMSAIFSGCSLLTSLDVSSFNTSKLTDMSFMFRFCPLLTSLDLSSFNTSQVTNMANMFDGCSSLNSLDLSNWNTSKVTNMSHMFNQCPTSDIGLLYATSSTINTLLTHLGTSVARNVYYTDTALNELTVQDNITYKKYELTKATLPYTLNKLPNGVADYIDVVNKVHVQRVGKIVLDGTEIFGETNYNIGDGYYTKRMIIDNSVAGKYYSSATECTSLLCNKLKTVNYEGFAGKLYEFIAIGSSQLTGYNSAIYIRLLASTNSEWEERLAQLTPITVLYELLTPIYTPLTEEEIAQLPLSAYADGSVMLSSDQLMPSFEFRMKASNRYQVDMLETGYYYLNAPVGNVKLGTANVDVQQMPCIVKVDNVGTGDSGYRLNTTEGFYIESLANDFEVVDYRVDANTGELIESVGMGTTGYYELPSYTGKYITKNIKNNNLYIAFYDENKEFIICHWFGDELNTKNMPSDKIKYVRLSFSNKADCMIKLYSCVALTKLPSHRIPTPFTQGMRCGTDFGYWEGIMESNPTSFRTVNTSSGWSVVETSNIEGGMGVVLNRIESGSTIIEDEFDVATGKFTKRVGTYTFNGNSQVSLYSHTNDTALYKSFSTNDIVNLKQGGLVIGFYFNKGMGTPQTANDTECWNVFNPSILYYRFRKDRYSYYGDGVDGVKAYFNANPTTIYYELEVPEISYLNTSLSQVKTVANTGLQCTRNNGYLNAQVKPSHLTYPVPSLVANREYTVVHNRKNITGSTKPITLDLGGTQVELNDVSSKTLIKTPSSLKHSSLIFIGGESTVDHIMVLDGDWTNKPIEYFENMMGHDTDAIITIIGNGQINDVEEQYLW